MLCRKWIAAFGLAALARLLTGDVLSAWAGPAPGNSTLPPIEARTIPTITVVGEGRISVRPDVAKANVGVVVTAPKVKEAIVRSRGLMVGVLAELKRAGIAEKDILTNAYSIYYEQPPPRADGGPAKERNESKGRYSVTNMVVVTIRDMEKVDAVLDAATGAGVNQVWGVSFEIENADSVAARARELAVVQARTKAEELAGASGLRLGPVISISEEGTGLPVRYGRAVMAMEAGAAGPISPGELTYSARIQVVYEIR